LLKIIDIAGKSKFERNCIYTVYPAPAPDSVSARKIKSKSNKNIIAGISAFFVFLSPAMVKANGGGEDIPVAI
jgi:hypothetical protein